MAIQTRFIVISGPLLHTKFMQAADCFEKGKVLGNQETMTFTFSKDVKVVTFAECERTIKHLREFLETKMEPKQIVSLIHLECIIYEDKVLLNTKLKCKPYINKSVRQISNGTNWGMFHEILTTLNIPFKLTENCFIL